MTRYRHIFWAALSALVLASCHRGPKAIPEGEMRSIMREALVSQAILQVDQSVSDGQPLDSLDVHTGILRKYGYTMEDFRFTIREMSMRKSNPLANILGGVAGDIKLSRIDAEGNYRELLRSDSIARARTADTVFRSDTVLRGKLDGYKFAYAGRVPGDSSVAPGTYKIEFDYSTGGHARSYTKSVRARRAMREGKAMETTLWLPTAKDTAAYSGEISVGPDVKLLEIALSETVRTDLPRDTCYLTGIRLVHILPVRQARALFLEQITGFPAQLYPYYEKRYLDSLAKRGGPVPPRAGR